MIKSRKDLLFLIMLILWMLCDLLAFALVSVNVGYATHFTCMGLITLIVFVKLYNKKFAKWLEETI